MDLKSRWQTLCDQWAAPKAAGQAAGQQLLAAYTHRARAYHNVQHIEACLTELEGCRQLQARPHVIDTAVFFHDAIYDVARPDNEARSAEWAARWLVSIGAAAEDIRAVERLIQVTDHTTSPTTSDEHLIADVDLSILGQSPAVYRAYTQAIRQEYAAVPEDAWRAGRAQVLQHFLRKDVIYHTDALRGRYEQQARVNLQAELGALAR